MQALKNRAERQVEVASPPIDLASVREHVATLLLDAITCTAPTRVSGIMQDWLDRIDPASLTPAQASELMAEALTMAATVVLFTPSAGGKTAFDRLAQRRGSPEPAELAARSVLRHAQFRLLRVEGIEADGTCRLRDLPSNDILQVDGSAIRADHIGLHLSAWLGPLPGGRQIIVTEVTPLDEDGLAVAMKFVRPGRLQLVNPLRCAEAVYRHVLYHGVPRIAGLNDQPAGEEDGLAEEPGELDELARQWSQPGAQRDADDVQFVRSQTDLDSILAVIASAANTSEHDLVALSNAYAAIAQIQIETIQRRASIGSNSLRMQTLEAALEAGIAAGDLSPRTRGIFAAIRQRLGGASGAGSGRPDSDAELEKLIGRIQALRAKTVEQGCTEQEALAAAEKVAELLDRYGLSLSELDLGRQSCGGVTVETVRKRAAPIDDCVPATAAFFDCRVWSEKSANGTLRYVFFGLPADVAASRYLYDLVDQAFARETALFRMDKTYTATPPGTRRTATNSFQIGLGQGIVAKLHALRTARETALRGSSGRDLVVVKADMVEAELAELGLNLRARSRQGRRRVLRKAFDQGHKAGLGFAYTEGITTGG